MSTRQRVVMTISVPPDTAKEYRETAKAKGESISQFFREIFAFYKQQRLEEEFYKIQQYGARKAKELKITERDIEKLIFEGR
jgi:hypothetical protein